MPKWIDQSKWGPNGQMPNLWANTGGPAGGETLPTFEIPPTTPAPTTPTSDTAQPAQPASAQETPGIQPTAQPAARGPTPTSTVQPPMAPYYLRTRSNRR